MEREHRVNLVLQFFASRHVSADMRAAGSSSIVHFGSISWMLKTRNASTCWRFRFLAHARGRSDTWHLASQEIPNPTKTIYTVYPFINPIPQSPETSMNDASATAAPIPTPEATPAPASVLAPAPAPTKRRTAARKKPVAAAAAAATAASTAQPAAPAVAKGKAQASTAKAAQTPAQPSQVAASAAKPAAKPKATPSVQALDSKEKKAKKPKLVRDSFTFPKDEYAAIESLKARALALGHAVKKSELLRAGLLVLSAQGDAALLKSIRRVPTIKTGRPKSGE
ncbi:MAG: hypothetical protein QM617_05770 [Comamonas sp.]